MVVVAVGWLGVVAGWLGVAAGWLGVAVGWLGVVVSGSPVGRTTGVSTPRLDRPEGPGVVCSSGPGVCLATVGVSRDDSSFAGLLENCISRGDCDWSALRVAAVKTLIGGVC